MKIKLGLSVLIALCFGFSAMPVHALGFSFNVYDHNHDGYWTRGEYYGAYRDWHLHHDRVYLPRAAVYRRFDTYDLNHDGRLSPSEVARIRSW